MNPESEAINPEYPEDMLQGERPLQSWKEIAAYLERDARTARRWEQAEALPVRRHRAGPRSSVYAYPSEIDAWRAAREPRATAASHSVGWRRQLVPATVTAVTLIVAAWIVAQSPILNPPDPLVEAASVSGPQLRQIWSGDEVDDVLGHLSPDGRYLSYIHWETGDLAVRDLETRENRLLTDKGPWNDSVEFALEPIFSADGKRIAYTWWNEADERYELRTVALEAGSTSAEPLVIYNNESEEVRYLVPSSWFPDGDKLLLSLWREDNSSQVAILSLKDGSLQPVRSLEWSGLQSAKLSPDGRWIAYDATPSTEEEQTEISVLSVDGSRENKVVEHPAFDDILTWTPGGEGLLFRSDRTGEEALWHVSVVDGRPAGEPELLRAPFEVARPVGMSPSGDLYYGVRTGDHDVYVASVDFETGQLIHQPVKPIQRYIGKNVWPSWSTDGKHLAYLSLRRNRSRRGYKYPTLVIRSAESGKERDFDLLTPA